MIATIIPIEAYFLLKDFFARSEITGLVDDISDTFYVTSCVVSLGI